MFNNVIYFIIVLLIFNISFPDKNQEISFFYNFGMILLCWFLFLGYCRWVFKRLLSRFNNGVDNTDSLTSEYHNLILRLSIFAILLFCLDVYLFHLKHWLQVIPGIKQFTAFQGLLAILLFFFYLVTIWHSAFSSYSLIFQTKLRRGTYILSNLRLNLPILLPWLTLTLLYDLIILSPWSEFEALLNRPEGQMIFFAVFLSVLVIFMPLFIQKLWGCEPFEQSEKVRALKAFLTEMGFKYRGLLRWPIFEGRMLTAGIMGIVPRFRYILVTDSLLEILTTQELKAVMAHETGHAKYHHLLFYIFFFIGYMVLSFGIFDILFSLIATNPLFLRLLHGDNPQSINLFYFSLAIPLLLTIIVYFRFIMGFFMRNFERQADLYSAVVMGSPEPTISSLEKIALMSGKSRDIPSWHHFSIKQRVDCLLSTLKNPGLVKRHNRFIRLSFIVYIVCIICLAYLLNFSEVKRDYEYKIVTNMLNRQLEKDPNNARLLQGLAMLYHEMEMLPEAAQIYDRMLSLNMNHAVALNNLAWLLITVDDESLRDPPRALKLAQRAVELDRLSIYLDTLAEAYFVSGQTDKAIETIQEAIEVARGDKSYFKKQLKKFMKAREG